MTVKSEDDSDTDLPGDDAPAPPLQETMQGTETDMYQSLIVATPAEAQEAEADTDDTDDTQVQGDEADDQAEPEVSQDEAEDEADPDEDGDEGNRQDPYLKKLSQQVATMTRSQKELGEQLAALRQATATPDGNDAGGAEQAQQDATGDHAEADAMLAEAEDSFTEATEGLAKLQEQLDSRDEYEGVEPADLKQVIKATLSTVGYVEKLKAELAETRQQATSATKQQQVERFFEQESKSLGIDAKAVWGDAVKEATKYFGDQKPGTPQFEMARQFANQRYQELKAERSGGQPKSAGKGKPSAVESSSPKSGTRKRGPGTQPRQSPKGTVTNPPGSRPVATTPKPTQEQLYKSLIVQDD